ncbi:MAG: hypothetical protein E6640_01730 [Actinomyces urogenitalis]|nr:hypothetical protein [Actinomyces urogenitalis]MDU6150931.1 hypothetical protein [Actinomyces urogenitalis]
MSGYAALLVVMACDPRWPAVVKAQEFFIDATMLAPCLAAVGSGDAPA